MSSEFYSIWSEDNATGDRYEILRSGKKLSCQQWVSRASEEFPDLKFWVESVLEKVCKNEI